MADAMVTGRMSVAKKDAGNRILEDLGLNASQAINQMYDFLIDEKKLPFSKESKKPIDVKRLKEAREFVRSIPRQNRFSSMTDQQIKEEKLNRLLAGPEERA